MAKDIYWPDTVLAMHMDAAGAIDLKGHTVTAFGNAAISATQSKFGGSSATFDGTGDYFSIPASEDFYFGYGDYTVEFWVYVDTLPPTNRYLIGHPNSICVALTAAGALSYVDRVSSNFGTITAGVWHHVAISRASLVKKCFLNGVQGYSSDDAYIAGSSTLDYNIGCLSGLLSNGLIGYIDDVRITKGVARYTTPFTPPIAAFPDEPYTVAGTVLDINGNGVVRTVRGYRRDTGALVGTTTSLFANGTYTMPVRHDGEVQVIMVDDDAGAIENDQILRTIPL